MEERYRDHLIEWVKRDCEQDRKAAAKEFDEKKIDLKENLLSDMEEKRKIIESDRHTMELTGDSMEVRERKHFKILVLCDLSKIQ